MQHVFIDTKICLIELQYIFTKKYILGLHLQQIVDI